METIKIAPQYKVFKNDKRYGIIGTETTTGEVVTIASVTESESEARCLANFLNKHKVSVYHASDVLRDRYVSLFQK